MTNLSPKKAACLVAVAAMLSASAWAANIDYPGYLKVENFDGIPGNLGNNITALQGFSKFIANTPDSITFVPTAHWLRDPQANDYGSRVSGYLIPTETAEYVFFVAADDSTSLYLSTDATPANLKLIAADQGWQATRAWTGVGGVSGNGGTTNVTFRRGYNPGPAVLEANGFQWVGPFENRSDEFLNSPRTNLLTGNAWPTTNASGNAVINLVANQRYYLELLFKEGGGGDYTSIAWKKAGDPDPENGIDGTEIPGSVLLVNWVDTMSLPVQPVSQSVFTGQAVTFSVTPLGVPGDSTNSLFTYDWFLNDVEITDGSGDAATYTIPSATLADNGKQFKVRVTSVGSSPAGVLVATSTNATLTVTEDLVAPTITRIVTSDTFNSAVVTFSEPVSNDAATEANYVFGGGLTVSEATFNIVVDAGVEDPNNPVNPTNRQQVILLTSTQAEGASYPLTINNVKDTAGNNLTPNTRTVYANVFRSGILTYKRYNGDKNGKDTVEASPLLLASPLQQETVTIAERGHPSIPEPGYVSVISGHFIAPVTTNYVFFISQDADNLALLYLSTDASPSNRKLISMEPSWQNQRKWTGSDGNTRRGTAGVAPFENRSDQFLTSDRATTTGDRMPGNVPLGPPDSVDPEPWPILDTSGNAFITLTGGVRYAFQHWHTERDGGGQSATYKYVGANNVTTEPDPVTDTASRLTGSVIGSFVDPSTLPPLLSISGTTITYSGRLLSSATAGGPYLPVAGATSPYTVPTPTIGNNFYRAVFP